MAQVGTIKVRRVIVAQISRITLHLQVAENKENIKGQPSPIGVCAKDRPTTNNRLEHNARSREEDIFWAHVALFNHEVILNNFPFHLIYMQSFPRWM